MEATRLCPYCLQPLPGAAQSCPHCGKSFAGRNPGGTLVAETYSFILVIAICIL